LVSAQLRPGADGSRADAELAAAKTQLAQAQQAVNVTKALLAQFVGVAPEQVAVSMGHLLQLPPEERFRFDAAQNPIATEQSTLVEKQKAELHVLEKTYAPRFLAQGSAYARGTGASMTGARLGGFNGLVPDTQNYALGMSVIFSALDFASVRARKDAQSATVRAETERSREIAVELTTQWEVAQATLAGARSVAANTPTEVSSADVALQQATARYRSGLGSIAEVADSQRLLTQAQIDDALARLNVWRALLHVAGVSGDIDSFLTEASR
jgi:outer membrane protein TolC